MPECSMIIQAASRQPDLGPALFLQLRWGDINIKWLLFDTRRETPRKRKCPVSVLENPKKKKKNHAELFIRWVPPAMIKGKMRTNEMQSLGDYITTGTFTGYKSHSHSLSLQGGWGKTEIRALMKMTSVMSPHLYFTARSPGSSGTSCWRVQFISRHLWRHIK